MWLWARLTAVQPMSDHLLEIVDLSVTYRTSARLAVNAVDRVSLTVATGETVGLVGESGSGKTSVGAATLGLAPISGGRVSFDGGDLGHMSPSQRRKVSARLQVIFQDPYSSLNPARTIEQTLVEPLLAHYALSREERAERVRLILGKVGLEASAARRRPTEFSGGQRQRIAIARALIVSPSLVICDEAVSALDLSVQAQVLNLLLDMQRELGLSYLFISHDLAVVRHMADRIVVLYKGQVMESGAADSIYFRPGHPYTQALLSAVPHPNPDRQRRDRRSATTRSSAFTPEGVTSTSTTGNGCPYSRRCAFSIAVCDQTRPPLKVSPSGALVACHRSSEVATADSVHSGRAQ